MINLDALIRKGESYNNMSEIQKKLENIGEFYKFTKVRNLAPMIYGPGGTSSPDLSAIAAAALKDPESCLAGHVQELIELGKELMETLYTTKKVS